jgi:hypothetical protein
MLDHLTRAALAADHRRTLAGEASGLRRGRLARARRAAHHHRGGPRADTR